MVMTKGYKQTADHVRKRIRIGVAHHHWLGDAVSERGGRTRALRAYPPGPCDRCGAAEGERHHADGNTANNRQDNVHMLCRRCHMETDGRLDALKTMDHDRAGEANGRAKLNAADVQAIRALREQGVPRQELAARYGVSGQQIYRIVTSKAWGAA